MEVYRIIGCSFFFSPVTDISATVAPIGTKFYMMVRFGPGHIFSLLGRYLPWAPRSELLGLNIGHLTANISIDWLIEVAALHVN